MRSKSNGTKQRQRIRRKQGHQNYGTLEARNLLATLVSVDVASGTLSISLDNQNDVAKISVAENLNVTVNGSHDLDTSKAGTQAIDIRQLKHLNITGDSHDKQKAWFDSEFVQHHPMESVEIANVNQITIDSTVSVKGDFFAKMSGSDGEITDSINGRLLVGGITNIDAGSNTVDLNNPRHDFENLKVKTSGHRMSAVVTDTNDVTLIGVETSGNFTLKASGEIDDARNTYIDVARDAFFTANSVKLGDHVEDSTNFFRSGFEVSGHVEVHEDSNTVLLSSDVGSMTIHSDGGILDGQRTQINVDGRAQLFGSNRVRLGEGDGNRFDAGFVEFRSNGQVRISENSTLKFVGDSSASNAVLSSEGNITNVNNTAINVDGPVSFQAANVVVGTRTGDTFNAGTITFRSNAGSNALVRVSEDSNTVISGTSQTRVLQLTSSGSITDSPTSDLNVTGNSHLKTTDGGRIVLGDSGHDSDGAFDSVFETRTLTVESDGNVVVEEDTDVILKGQNRANSMTLMTRGAEGRILDTLESQIDVRYNLSVVGRYVNLGTAIIPNGSSTDRLEFSTLTVTSSGNVNVSADDTILLTGNSSVGGFLSLESEGNIRTTRGSELISEEGARFAGMDIYVGNLDDDCFDIINSNEDGSKRLTVLGQGAENVQLGCSAGSNQGSDS